jgi:antigen flippase
MSSYRQIFKSTVLIGGTQVINILIGIVRTKFLAILLGPAGVGIAGLYQSTTGLIGTIAGFGIGRAGVRQIAEAVGSGDEDKIALTSITLRRASLISGLFGMLVVLLFCKPLAWATFGSNEYAWGIAIVSPVLLFDGISSGQKALLQGMRKLKELALCQIWGAIFGSFASIIVIYFWGKQAVMWYLVAIAAFGILVSWWYARKVRIIHFGNSIHNMIVETRSLLKMGGAFMVSGLIGSGTIYLTRALLIRELGMDAVGLYMAVITLSSIYVNMVLQAMLADYYPRLTAVACNHESVNQLINEQTEMGLLMAIPGILVTISLAPWVLEVFYSKAFTSATDVIRWQILGIALRVLSWPLSIIMPAMGLPHLMVIAETVAGLVQIVLFFICIKQWGLEGTGISFFLTYAVYAVVVFLFAKKITGFYWSQKSLKVIGLTSIVVVATFLSVLFLPKSEGTFTSLLITAGASVSCLFAVKRMLGFTPVRREAR